MKHKVIVMGTTFSQPTFKKRALAIITPFVSNHLVQQILCINLDPQRADPDECSVALYSKETNQLAIHDCTGEEATEPLGILKMTNAVEALDDTVDPDSIFLHQF
ncbi:hypothetical protein [Levilactobacillus spicheri]|uniref:Uncharacterized protein n=2 Tax=Levilactobacillus spicheri TaxID=216463 RepID=A0A0F3RPW6_9LACO|nr:hypothetical protein [Levilactobacillus spicheri]KJW11639.1 hypothetical protein VC81_12635 [Levilactobacillus spicheri]KRL48277.1 hypothetical protein FD37_GL001404 [Levilactobacillus spicheri DSM 15429]GEO66506.1 hypothetical protein LSP04_09250 [Levilactobacillus spicheri]